MPKSHTPQLIDIDHLLFAYDSRAILKNLSLQVKAGEILTVMGGSGCGKSTLLNLIAGRLKPVAGSVEVLGQNVAELDEHALGALRKNIGMLFQTGALLNDMNVYENVAFPLREHTKLPQRLIHIMVLMKLHMVGLRGAATLECSELSGGMARRVALARALAMDPKILLYDEPFSGLDPISSAIIARTIREVNHSQRATSIVVSHHLKEAYDISDRICLLGEGTIQALDTPAGLQRSQDDWVQQFICASDQGPVAFHHPAPEFRKQLMDDE